MQPYPNEHAVSISVVMPAYNAAGQLRSSLIPLAAMLKRGLLLEVIVVDDGSRDDSAMIAKGFGVDVVVSHAVGAGPGAARNIGANHALGEILWFVDADVVVTVDAARIVRDGFRDIDISAVFGAYDDRPAAPNFLSQYKNLVHRYYHRNAAGEVSTFWSGCGAIRKLRFDALGGFDTRRFTRPSIEDIELGYRLTDAGDRIVMVPELQATHLKEWRFANLLHTEIFCRALPWSRLLLARESTPHDLNISNAERARAGLAGLALVALLLAASPWVSAWLAPVAIALVAVANARLLRFFMRERGGWFALRALAFHQFYYLYSGATFSYAWIESRVARLWARRSKRAVNQ